MSKGNEAKFKFAEALESAMTKKPLSKIKINDITAKSGLSRQTFYRHFKDIYDLIIWTHCEKIHLAVEVFEENRDIEEFFRIFLKIMLRNKSFYQQVVSMDGQHSFSAHHCSKLRNTLLKLVEIENVDEEIIFVVDSYAMASLSLILEWITAKNIKPPERMAKLLVKAMPANLCYFAFGSQLPVKGIKQNTFYN